MERCIVPHWFKSRLSWRTRERPSAFASLRGTLALVSFPNARHASESWHEARAGRLRRFLGGSRAADLLGSALHWPKEAAEHRCCFPLAAASQRLPAAQAGPVTGTAAFLAASPSITPAGCAYGCSLHACGWHLALPLASGTPFPAGHVTLRMTVRAVIRFSGEPADFLHAHKQILFCNAQERFHPNSYGRDREGVFSYLKKKALLWHTLSIINTLPLPILK